MGWSFSFSSSFSALVCCPMTTVWLVQVVEWGVCERVWSLQRIGWNNERSARAKRDAERARIRTRRMVERGVFFFGRDGNWFGCE